MNFERFIYKNKLENGRENGKANAGIVKILLLKKYFMLDIHNDFNLNWLGCLGEFYFRMLGLYNKQL